MYRELFPSGSTPGVLHGLPKVYKENCPIRPFLSAIGTNNYKLAKFLVPLVQPSSNNQYTVTDSFSFVNEISSNNSFFMASFDVSSLFTCIPLNEDMKICTYLVLMNKILSILMTVKLIVVTYASFLLLLLK